MSAVFWHFPLVMFCKHSLQSTSALANQSSRSIRVGWDTVLKNHHIACSPSPHVGGLGRLTAANGPLLLTETSRPQEHPAYGSIHRAFAIGRNWRTVASFALLGRGLLKLRSPPAEKGEGEVQPPTAKEDSVFSLRLDDVERKLPRERHIRARIQ